VKINSWVRRATNRSAVAALPLALAAGLACGKGGPPAAAPSGAAPAAIREPVDFAFDSIDDRAVDSESMRGAVTVLAFVTTANLASQAQIDFLIAMAKNDGDRVHYAAVALEAKDDREMVELYRKALSIPFPVALADARTLAGDGPFGDVRTVPAVVILDRSGRVAWRTDGRVTKSAELRAAMHNL
jgi:hypothetical protein